MSEISPIPIKELLIEATFAPNRALRCGVEAIDLGVLGKEAERIFDKSIAEHNGKKEYLLPVIVTPTKKLFLRKEEISGADMHVSGIFEIKMNINYYDVPKQRRQSYFIAANIHNHPVPMPPSPRDFMPLFIEDINPGGNTATFISSVLEKIIVFRGEKTPEWTWAFAEQRISAWDAMIRSRVEKFLAPGMPYVQMDDLNRRVQMAWLRDVVAKYDLQAFSCPLRENIARRMIFANA